MPALDGANEVAANQRPLLSNPANFDASKPFMYNGQMVYPMPQPATAHATLAPLLGIPSSNYVVPPFQGMPVISQTSMPGLAFGAQAHAMPLFYHPSAVSAGARHAYSGTPSSLTRSQLHALRAQMDLITKQQLNENATSSSAFEAQLESLQINIDLLEKLFNEQIFNEHATNSQHVSGVLPQDTKKSSG